MVKALFDLEIFRFLSWLFGYVEKALNKKAMVNFRLMTSQTGYNTHITQYLKE